MQLYGFLEGTVCDVFLFAFRYLLLKGMKRVPSGVVLGIQRVPSCPKYAKGS